MGKLSLFGLFVVVAIVVSQLENLKNAVDSLPANGIPPMFCLAMLLSLLIIISLVFSLRYIRKIAKLQC